MEVRKVIPAAVGIVLFVLAGSLPTLPSLPTATKAEKIPFVSSIVETSEDYLRYEKLDLRVPLHTVEADPFMQQDWETFRDALRKGAAITAVNQTEKESSEPLHYIIGHSSDTAFHNYAFVFARLGQAKVGDTLQIQKQGVSMTYRVVETKVCDSEDKSCFPAHNVTSTSRVVLVTCWPLFTTNKRLLVIADAL